MMIKSYRHSWFIALLLAILLFAGCSTTPAPSALSDRPSDSCMATALTPYLVTCSRTALATSDGKIPTYGFGVGDKLGMRIVAFHPVRMAQRQNAVLMARSRTMDRY